MEYSLVIKRVPCLKIFSSTGTHSSGGILYGLSATIENCILFLLGSLSNSRSINACIISFSFSKDTSLILDSYKRYRSMADSLETTSGAVSDFFIVSVYKLFSVLNKKWG